ncbi:cytidylate kinase [Sporanaerobium hydrogeniformans]|uniref:Cytidylate kinase n=1 Tax=Sporanaerobium hydrogeniformans TaxID=3072179 RepID=A0AC61DE57_9FIRM|nr:(d)CMP kinase [Sporanaerobium hydrogeniformans]PHV71165.1 cytidylate kinase [Sporanaerobium hydrogeniformans]
MISIAIDGPAGAGKSTIAKELAKRLGCIYVDTGAMYRAVGLYCLRQNIDYNEETEVNAALPHIKLDIEAIKEGQKIYLNGQDVSTAIRTSEVAAAASKVATYGEVRKTLVSQQRQMKEEKSLVMDGRDIGTVVMPDATLKIFLTASSEERAKRRYLEYKQKGMVVDLQTLIQEIEERDYQDSHRSISPLKKAEDAKEVDTTFKTVDEIVTHILHLLA